MILGRNAEKLEAVAAEIREDGGNVATQVCDIRDEESVIAAIDANGLRPVVDRVFPLDGIVEAFMHQASQKHFGKICLEI